MEIGIWGDSIYTRIIKEYMEKLKYLETRSNNLTNYTS